MKKIKSEEYEAEVDSWFAIHHRNTVEKKKFSHDVAGVDVLYSVKGRRLNTCSTRVQSGRKESRRVFNQRRSGQ